MKQTRQAPLALLCAVLAAALYGLSAPFSKLLLDGVQPTMLAGLLYLGAGLGMAVLVVPRALTGHIPRAQVPGRADAPFVLGMVALDIAAPVLLLCGLARTAAANAALLNNFEIVATALIALLLFREAVPARLWVAIALVTAASVMLSCEDIGASLRFSPGSLLVLGACVCWGLENNCTRRLSAYDPTVIVLIKGFGSGGGALCIALLLGQRLPDGTVLLSALLLGFVAYGLSICCYIRAQRGLGAARTSAYYALAPFFGSALSLFLLHEQPEGLFWPALAVMLAGAYLASATPYEHTHAGVRSIDYFAYVSGLNGWNAAFKTVLSVGTIVLCIALDRPAVSLAVILAMGWLTVRRGRLPLHDYLALLRVPLAFLLLSGLAVACTVSRVRTGDWALSLHWFYISVTRESVRFALALTLKALGAVSAMYLLALSTPAGELTGVLRRAHMPALVTELMYLIYRFIFILLDTHGRMRDAAEARLGYCDLRTSLRSFGWTAGNLLVSAVKRSGAYYDAMESRCYSGSLRFLERDKPARAAQYLWAAVFWAVLLALAFAVR